MAIMRHREFAISLVLVVATVATVFAQTPPADLQAKPTKKDN